MITADQIIKRFEGLEAGRREMERAWRKCADYVLPRLAPAPGRGLIFDSTAPLAAPRLGAVLEAVLTPRGRRWHGLAPASGRPGLADEYLAEVLDILFQARLRPEANFHNQMSEAYLSLGVFGTAVMMVDDHPGLGLRYKCLPLQETYLAENYAGRVDTVFRLYKLTARQALMEFGKNLPEPIQRDAADPGRLENEHEFIHGLFPRRDLEPGRAGPLQMPVASIQVARAARQVVRESGYRVMPLAVSRFGVSPGQVYGRSPAMEAMPDIVQINAMKKTLLRAAEKMVNPPLLLPEDEVLSAFSLRAGSLNYGGLDDQGRQRVVALKLDGQLPIGLSMIEKAREVIEGAFYLKLFQILTETPNQTAAEVWERAREKAQLLGPVLGRQQSELLRPLIDRELDILRAAGALPPPPAGWGELPTADFQEGDL
ncbi:MAG: head-tail connector protein [Candidatus Adiutrix sp.]|jgi:hypothetical protein|nr:head-tail connector protein [Candidatus Adiutrix sp.]